MWNIKFIFLFGAFFLLTQYSYSQNDSTTLFIKDGSSVHIIASKIYKTGLLSSQGQGVSFRVIDSIWTMDNSLANQIQKIYSGVEIKDSNQGFVLIFPVIELPENKPVTSPSFQNSFSQIDSAQKFSLSIDSTILYIKNGLPIHFDVSEIYDKAIVDINNNGVSYSVIDSIWTSDSSVARRINEVLPEMVTTELNHGYLLNLTSIKLPEYKPNIITFARLKTHSYLYSPSTSHRIGIQLDDELYSLQWFFVRFEGAFGFRSNLAPFSYINFNAGLGYEIDGEWLIFKTVIGYGMYAQENDYKANNGTSSIIFVSPSIQVKMAKELNILFLVGANSCLYRSIENIPEERTMYYVGFGFLL